MTEHIGADNVHTRRMAEFVSALSYERVPQAVRERIKLLILDSLGCAIHGAHLPWCSEVRFFHGYSRDQNWRRRMANR